MEINLNINAAASYELFFIEMERANEILNIMSGICADVVYNFEQKYKVSAVVEQSNGKGELMHRINIGKVLSNMLEIAQTEDEKNFILYTAHTGIAAIDKQIFDD